MVVIVQTIKFRLSVKLSVYLSATGFHATSYQIWKDKKFSPWFFRRKNNSRWLVRWCGVA